MDQTEADAIDGKYNTITDLLDTACYAPNELGQSEHGVTVYRFPINAGINAFCIRVDWNAVGKESDFKKLLSTISLVPVGKLLTGENLGQRLLETNNATLSILLTQPGTSLWLTGSNPDCDNPYERDGFSGLKMLNTILRLAHETRKNPFIPLLEDGLRVAHSGYIPDLHTRNILLDPASQRLLLVDQISDNRQYLHPSDDSIIQDMALQVVIELNSRGGGDTQYQEARTRAYNEVIKLIEEAECEVLKSTQNKQFGGHIFASTQPTKAIALTNPPNKLVAELKRLHSIVNTPQR